MHHLCDRSNPCLSLVRLRRFSRGNWFYIKEVTSYLKLSAKTIVGYSLQINMMSKALVVVLWLTTTSLNDCTVGRLVHWLGNRLPRNASIPARKNPLCDAQIVVCIFVNEPTTQETSYMQHFYKNISDN